MTDQLGHRDCGNLPHLVDVNAVVVMSEEDPQGTDISPREAGTSGRKRITEGGARFTDDLEQPHGDATHSQQRPADPTATTIASSSAASRMSATRWSSPRLTEGWLRVECDHRDPSTHQQRPRRQGLPTAFRAPCSNAADRRVNCPARTPPGSRYHSSLTHLLEPPIQRQRPTGPDAVEQSRKSRPASPRRVPDAHPWLEITGGLRSARQSSAPRRLRVVDADVAPLSFALDVDHCPHCPRRGNVDSGTAFLPLKIERQVDPAGFKVVHVGETGSSRRTGCTLFTRCSVTPRHGDGKPQSDKKQASRMEPHQEMVQEVLLTNKE